MAELIWSDPAAKPGELAAVYRGACGATVKVIQPTESGMDPDGVPKWARVAMELKAAEVLRYMRATGHEPTPELLEAFDRDRARDLEAYIRDPMGHPWKYVSLEEYEKTAPPR